MDKKYGVYICQGCGIGEAVDIEKLSEVPKEEGLAVKTCPILCSKAGVELLEKDIADEGVNTLVIAACSRRVLYDVFRFDGCIVDRVNLREGVVWTHPRSTYPAPTAEQKDDETFIDPVQMMAEDYLKMGMARVEKVDLPEPYLLEALNKKILVIGGGMSGISAAIDAAKTGYEVAIVEKEASLGGYAGNWRKQLPGAYPYEDLIPPAIESKINELENYSNITVKTETVVARIAGEPGDFTVTLKKPGEKTEFDVPYPLPDEMKVDDKGKDLDAEALHAKFMEYNEGKEDILTLDPNGEKFGAVILAAGWRPYEPEDGEFAHLGFGTIADVVTNHQFEEIAAAGKIMRPSDGQAAKSVVFIQSPGQGDDRDFAYTGAVTSLVALKQAKYLREDYDDGKSFVFYQHMRTLGLTENFYKNIQQDPGIFLTKGEVTGVSQNGDGLIVEAENTLLGEKVQVKADMVVLATGMVPVTKDDPVVNLAYRQGPGFRDNAPLAPSMMMKRAHPRRIRRVAAAVAPVWGAARNASSTLPITASTVSDRWSKRSACLLKMIMTSRRCGSSVWCVKMMPIRPWISRRLTGLPIRRRCASFRSGVWGRSTSSGSRTPWPRGWTVFFCWAANTVTITSAISSRAASWPTSE
jgi:quinone-modifying oxidoreductase subunit QmoB